MVRSPVFLIRNHGCSLSLNLIDRVHKGLDIQMRVHTFGERHCTGVSHDFLDHNRLHLNEKWLGTYLWTTITFSSGVALSPEPRPAIF